MMIRRAFSLAALAAIASLAACDEDTVTGPGFVCDITNPVREVFAVPSRVILVHSPALPTDTASIQALATNRFGEARDDVAFEYRSSDESIATVDDDGIVTALRPGTVRITAEACGKSVTTDVTVVASIARVEVSPALDTVVAGDTATVTARGFAPDGSRVPNVKFTFAASNPSVTVVATSDSTASVVSAPSFSGAVTITATGEGTAGTGGLLILARVFLAGTVVSPGGIDGGDDAICGIIATGQLFCWGLNNIGQLGAETDSTCYPGVELVEMIDDTVAVTNKPCSLDPLRVSRDLAFSVVSAGDSTSCGLTPAGKAYCWGEGEHGEIGNGNVAAQESPEGVGGAHVFSTISAGGSHVCALETSGRAWCWGNDLDGQLGDDRLIHSTTPIPVSGGNFPAVFSSISAGFRHTCALNAAGVAFCWGNNDFGQLGVGSFGGLSDAPVAVATSLRFQSLSAGGDHTCGLTTAGAAFCWGSNAVGQLGRGTIGDSSPVPVAVTGGLTFSRISASSGSSLINPDSPQGLPFKVARGHTCGLTTGGAILCWGDNRDLQLGRGPASGSNVPSGVPVQVAGGELPAGVTFVSVTTGVRQGCGVGSDGAAYCWGSNAYGALGNTLQAAFRGFPQRVATPR
jgi:alpha-tubulin suppressor-like RCC1 family protein